MTQISLSGCGFIDFAKIIASNKTYASKKDRYSSIDDLLNSEKINEEYVAAGIISEMKVGKSRNGDYLRFTLQDNTDSISVMLWNDVYAPLKNEFSGKEGSILLMMGKLVEYNDRKNLQSGRNTKIEFI